MRLCYTRGWTPIFERGVMRRLADTLDDCDGSADIPFICIDELMSRMT